MNKKLIINMITEGRLIKANNFEEAYNFMKKRYLDFWDEEEWNEEYPFEQVKAEFDKDKCVGFCDGDAIMTLEEFLEICCE